MTSSSFAASILLFAAAQQAEPLPKVESVELQPLLVHVGRLREALDFLGNPLSKETAALLDAAAKEKDEAKARDMIQDALDPYCLIGVNINPESRVKAQGGPAPRKLVEQGWRQFLIKVQNEAGVTARLNAQSPQAMPMWDKQTVGKIPPVRLRDLWLDLQLFGGRPLAESLSGIGLEYRILQLYSRDAGQRSAVISFNVGQGTQDIGFRSDILLTFDIPASTPVTFSVLDEEGKPSVAGFVITDRQGRTYPSQAKRTAPDFFFHPQIYRADGEQLKLPPGRYRVECTRGPEYVAQVQDLEVGAGPAAIAVRLKRWIDPAKFKWWSGDHHIHAAGCAHYVSPSEGVHAPDMLRHCMGEDLKIGANLTWGPCFDYQKQFFTGAVDKVSQYPYLLRYDVEVSGFGSHRSGHLCLLRLKEQIYPGGDSSKHWPTLCLNTLRWAKKQGAVCGPAHSGWGLQVSGDRLPTDEVPPFDGIGANEYIVDVTHQVPGPDGKEVPAVDFISTVDTPYVWELNIWYHTLNVGFRTRISGETDFPCIYGERVGLGRAYVKLDGKLDYDDWCEGIRRGRAYVGDGRSHLIDMKVGGVELGTNESELKLSAPGVVPVAAKVAALLPVEPDPALQQRPYTEKPYWHVERARVGATRSVKLELVVNAQPVAQKLILADGSLQDVSFDAKIERSSWVALRILPSSHTNPVFVLVGDKPIRASRRSAEWCLKSVDRCESQKRKLVAPDEQDDMTAAYDHAREVYRARLSESEVD
jgi:hypothetical protein